MLYSKKSDHSLLFMGSAMVGGFLLGCTYKRYGKKIEKHIQKFWQKDSNDDMFAAHESEI
ncbi:MAG: hypothetical protein FNP40_11670 [Dehalobacter sp. 4CP]|jgi:hypothetical protein|uniref:Lipoprotein n=3 Tax=Dehalobacter TaxID=56112 RepID=A0A857DKE7_9FIRM|nr:MULTISPECIES: hypothetical protein [Dehalobacter]NBJ16198.1 hypothetical protein [Dehalobacter sp. 4CP]AFV02023.1 hypothetical protein DHBDCA_p996 [Dehalobacter sp. DCA]AFV05058.1 hypothetical protein DCF50_p1053 [Dehalobacter sp. CF]AHF10280.1 hypothetical protein DEHRE_09450 [Dehalobacter restrictus DSM 9455]MCG1024288.1 hypothetical protein [Dehalobacter sp.]